MTDEYKLEVPDFAALSREPAPCGNVVCNECCQIVQSSTCRTRFGLNFPPVNPPNVNCVCHDICVQEVTHICAQPFDFNLPYPPVGVCRLGLPAGTNFPSLTPNELCRVVVTCAEEILESNCTCITLRVGLMIICGSGTNVVAIPTCITLHCNATDFFSFPDCVQVPSSDFFRTRIIPEIEGSCLLVQVRAQVNATGTAIRVIGKLVDKLWKHENLWVVALRPYDLAEEQRNLQFRSFTIKNEFTTQNHAIGPCSPNLCAGCGPNNPCSV